MLPRLWGNKNSKRIKNGDLSENGSGKFKNIDTKTLSYIKGLGVSHVWYTGIIRHATIGSNGANSDWIKGKAGSPYSISDYFDVNPYLATDKDNRMKEFENLISRTHRAGLKVIIDFIPNHVARNYGQVSPKPIINGRDALGHPVLGAMDDKTVSWKAENDFFYYPGNQLVLPVKEQTYYENPAMASGNSCTSCPDENDWYDTIKINYCDFHTSSWDFMYEVLDFWAGKGVDGFRCDMVELVPIPFLRWLIRKIKDKYPDIIFIAEVYKKNSYNEFVRDVGFDYLYDKSGLYDALHDIVCKNINDTGVPVEMWQSARKITWNWQSLSDLQPYMLNFIENHDEQRFASDFYGKSGLNGFAALGASLFFNTSAFMLYFGQEIGEKGMDDEGFSGINGRTSIFDWWSVDSLTRLYDTIHGKDRLNPEEKTILQKYRSALTFASTDAAVSMGATYDLCYCNLSSDGFNQDRHFAFLRDYEDETLLFVCNFSTVASDMSIMIPEHAFEWLHMPQTQQLNHNTPIKVHVEPCSTTWIRLC